MKVFVELRYAKKSFIVSGGLDICFDGRKQLELDFEENEMTARQLIQHLRVACNQKKMDFFVSQDGIRPGILVLINDADWELEEKEEAMLRDRDRVSFISTLHGG